VTDTHPGGLLGREFDFSATVSPDDDPVDVRRKFEGHGLTVTSVCAHANLLDPSAPGRYGTEEIMKAIRLADGRDVDHVITTDTVGCNCLHVHDIDIYQFVEGLLVEVVLVRRCEGRPVLPRGRGDQKIG